MEAQQIAEFICHRQAKRQKIDLKPQFWLTSIYWAKEYKKHVVAAHSLLKVYTFTAIMNALKRREAWWITSLRCKQLHDLCKEELQKEQSRQEVKPIETVQYDATSVPQSGLVTNNKLTKLRD